MILHVFNSTNKVFYLPFISFINDYFGDKGNFFAIIGKPEKELPDNVFVYDDYWDKDFINKVKEADKVILHSLSCPKYVLFLFFNNNLIKKHIWIAWGADIHFHAICNSNKKYYLYENIVRKNVIPKFYKICTLVEDDYVLVKKWYDVSNNYLPIVYVNEELNNFIQELKRQTNNHGEIRIVLGNSATKSNNHIAALELLEKFKEENIKIYCPLSYGDMTYATEIKKIGKEKFGDKFIALLDFMNQKDYFKLLSSMDIGVFNNTRQQSLGNVYVLLELEKKVYLSENSDMWNGVTNSTHATVYSVQNIENMSFDEFAQRDLSVLEKNEEKMHEYNSVDYAKKVWKGILNS